MIPFMRRISVAKRWGNILNPRHEFVGPHRAISDQRYARNAIVVLAIVLLSEKSRLGLKDTIEIEGASA